MALGPELASHVRRVESEGLDALFEYAKSVSVLWEADRAQNLGVRIAAFHQVVELFVSQCVNRLLEATAEVRSVELRASNSGTDVSMIAAVRRNTGLPCNFRERV
jgi:hypothetical protein